jgi:DNA-binding transcriptional regulator YiaG
MTEGRFARSVGVSPRTVSNWAQYPAMVPRSAAQDRLDELLAATNPAVRARFGQLAGEQPVSSMAVAADGGTARVVSLGIHPRYAADFRALACGQVSAARAALGMSTEGFRVWLGTMLGWTAIPGAVERWEACRACPPGDVVMAARSSLAGAR